MITTELPAGAVLDQVTELLAHLAPTDEQKQLLEDVLRAHKPRVDSLLERDAAARSALRDATQKPTVDEAAVTEGAEKLAGIEARLALERATIFSELAQGLEADQLVKLIRFVARTERQIGLREQAGTLYPKARLRQLELTREQRKKVDRILRAHRAHVNRLLAARATARTTTVVAISQRALDEGLVETASRMGMKTEEKLAVERARLHAELGAVLTEAQLVKIAEGAAKRDDGIVVRLRALGLLFLQVLGPEARGDS